MMWWLLTSREWTAPRPINVYVIEHSDGLVLFDTGQDRRSVTDTDYFPSGFTGHVYSRLARFAIAPDETLSAGLRSLGYEPEHVTTVVLSHLHQDHIGGIADLPKARILVSAAEWAELDASSPEPRGFLVRHIRLPGLVWEQVSPTPTEDESIAPFTSAHDLFGDGRLLLLPTPGHTAGSLSMLLRQDGLPPMLFVGDLTYDVDLLGAGRVPGVGSHRGLVESTRAVAELRRRNPGLLVLAAHDPAAAGILATAVGAGASR
jgi:glyoxylase-like metal-dependent hydrolase (beta-lactamase superfamily II)